MKLPKNTAGAPMLRPIYNPYSVKYYVFVDGNIKELLFHVSKHNNFNWIKINYVRLKFWLHKGLKVDPHLIYFIT